MKRWGVVLFGVFIASSAFASLAPWSGEANTTYQSWTFNTGAIVSAPDVDGNSYGDPVATVSYGVPFSPYNEEHLGHEGVWHIEDWIEFYIPNTDNTDPGSYKQVWVEIVYWAEVGAAEFFSVPSISGGVELVDSEDAGGGYVRSTYSFIIEPNPTEELIYLLPQACSVYVDEVVIETICVPEPATLLLLGLGGLLIRRKK